MKHLFTPSTTRKKSSVLNKTIIGLCCLLLVFTSNALFADYVIKNASPTQPTAGFTVTSATIQCVYGNSFTFAYTTATNRALGFTYQWNFNDGTVINYGPISEGELSVSYKLPVPIHTYSTPGNHLITLIVTNSVGIQAYANNTVVVVDVPQASFTNSTSLPNTLNDNVINFNANAYVANGSVNYDWVFGDAGTTVGSTVSNPTHTYSSAIATGTTEKVVLTASNSLLSSCYIKTGTTIIVYNYVPTVPFAGTISLLGSGNNGNAVQCLSNTDGSTGPDSYTFTSANASVGTDLKYTWSFGDGSSYNGLTPPAHTYSISGQYSVTLTVANIYNGAQATASYEAIVVAAPQPSFSNSKSVSGTSSSNIIFFTNTSSVASNGISNVLTYYWSFGDGSNSLLTNPEYVYPVTDFGSSQTSIVEPVTLTAASTYSYLGGTAHCRNSVTNYLIVYKPVTITPTVSSISLTSGKTTQCISSNSFTFSNSNTATDYTYVWNFGDGTSTTTTGTSGGSIVHNYLSAGTYTTTLNVTNGAGSTKSSSTSITVAALPNASFTYAISSSSNPNIVDFNSTSSVSNGSMYYSWIFGDNGSTPASTLSSPIHTYSSAVGTTIYPVTLIVYNTLTLDKSCFATSSTSVTVKNPSTVVPSANIELSSGTSATQCITSNTYTVLSQQVDNSLSYQWNFGDGYTTTGSQATHSYNNGGNYTIKLTIYSNNSALSSSTATYNVTVLALPNVSFAYNSNTVDGENDSYTFVSNSYLPEGTMTYAWSFGDASWSCGSNETYSDPNNTATISNPYHKFYSASYPYNTYSCDPNYANFNNNGASQYSVTLAVTVNGLSACSASKTNVIWVYPGDEGFSAVNKNSVTEEVANKISVYPNPASSVVKASFVATSDKATIKVVDLYGRVVKTISQSTFVGKNTIAELNIENLTAGIYAILILDDKGNKIATNKFIKAGK